MTSDDIRKVTFEKGVRGYRTEDVDDYLQQMAKEFDALQTQLQEAIADKEDTENKIYVLAEKVEEYRGQEETLKTALINAQRMGETVVHEAKQKAEAMVREATGKAQLLRERAEAETLNEQNTLEKMQGEVTRFKATILNLYKQHIESLSALDEPVEHTEAFLQENARDRVRDMPEEMEEDTVIEASVLQVDVQEEAPPEESAAASAQPAAVNLFEGVPIDDEL